MIPLNTLKSIRKWRDRLFMLGENALDRCTLRSGKKILFSPWPEVEAAVHRGFKFTRHTIEFGAIPPGGGNYDLVVPVSPEALIAASEDSVLKRRNPLPIPSAAAVNLCDDKAALNARLSATGFARHIPEGDVPGRFPYMLKRRRDSCARHAYRIAGPADEEVHREKIASPDYLRQDWIAGNTEFSAHLLHIRGRVRRALSMSFRMRDPGAIRGRDSAVLMRRCHSRHVPLFEAMLNAAGFEGLCCVNYKMSNGIPMILEINPRFGFSLGPFFSAFVRSLEWDRGRTPPGGHRP